MLGSASNCKLVSHIHVKGELNVLYSFPTCLHVCVAVLCLWGGGSTIERIACTVYTPFRELHTLCYCSSLPPDPGSLPQPVLSYHVTPTHLTPGTIAQPSFNGSLCVSPFNSSLLSVLGNQPSPPQVWRAPHTCTYMYTKSIASLV